MLNPTTQARRFDPHGDYVRRGVPELSGLDSASMHRPWVLGERGREALGYPAPLVDIEDGLARFRQAQGLD